MKVTRICEGCGREFEVAAYRIKDGRGKFCSKKCQYQWMSKNQKGENNPNYSIRVTRTCEACGREFELMPYRAANGPGRFCSKECRSRLITKKCETCGREFSLYRSQAARGGRFCSRECYCHRITVTCKECGQEFGATSSKTAAGRGKFCSKKCKDQWTARNQKRGKAHPQWKRVKRTCEWCGKVFEGQPSAIGRFCSMRCKGAWMSSRRGKDNPSWHRVEIKCENCGKSVMLRLNRIKRDARFCSQKCYGQWFSKNKMGEKNHLWRRLHRRCEICGKEFDVRPSAIRQGQGRFCSRKCNGMWKSEHYSGENSSRWRGGASFKPYPSTFNSHFKQLIRERDHYACAICGKSPAKDVHHINHVKADTTPNNCITLCQSCHGKVNNIRDGHEWEKRLLKIVAQRMAKEENV